MAAASNELIIGAFPASVDVLVLFDDETIAYGMRRPDMIEGRCDDAIVQLVLVATAH